jgi:DNA-binding response OmpR family regulator
MQVLIVEDDRLIAENLYDFLESCGHACDYAATLGEARRLVASLPLDALLIDRNLPDGDGIELVAALRAAGNNLPVLLLTARAGLDDKLAGFEAGADDYLVKPFALKELEARLLALLRRGAGRQEAGPLSFGGLVYEPATHNVCLDGRRLRLPPKALRLLAAMLPRPNRVFSRHELEVAVWGQAQASSDNLRSMLHTVRKAFGEAAAVDIVNAHGLGYKLVAR